MLHLSFRYCVSPCHSGEVHTSEVLLYRPRVSQRDSRRHSPGRVPSDRGCGGWLWPDTGRLDGGSASILHQTRFVLLSIALQQAEWPPFKKSGEIPRNYLRSCILFQAYYLTCHVILPPFKIGITKLRFKPAYNPYTEPSMEVFSYHEGKIGSLFFSAFTHAVFSLFVKYWCWPKQLIWGCRGYLSRFPSVSHLYSHISITVRMQFNPIAGSEPNVPCILGCGQHFIFFF